MFNFQNYSIRVKLIVIFIIFKILPIILLAVVGIISFNRIEKLLYKNYSVIIKNSKDSINSVANLTINDSIQALDKKSQENLEKDTVLLAKNIADFLRHRDIDILYLSKIKITKKNLEKFYNSKQDLAYIPLEYTYDDKEQKWIPVDMKNISKSLEKPILKDNAKEFHKSSIKKPRKRLIPLYKEISYYGLDGQEIYKISQFDNSLKNISDKNSTYLKAEDYFIKSKNLKEGEIYVSHVIGKYVKSPLIGVFTKEKARKAHIDFEPQKYGYAGVENPKGKVFQGIIRFVTPVYKAGKIQGFLTLALNHKFIMDFTDFFNPSQVDPLLISDASNGNYAFMWSDKFQCISHPRDYFIIGYDSNTGEQIPGWIDADMAEKFKKSSSKNLNSFLETQPQFFHQSLKNRPNTQQIKSGEIGLDCRYLNFAPQCQGWKQLVGDGGYGSFVIYWSGVWKLTTAAAIPYYTGDYGKTKMGFGFVTIGANVDEFHKATTITKQKIDSILDKEKDSLQKNIIEISGSVSSYISSQIKKISLVTLFLIVLVIYIAILLANYITNPISKLIEGTKNLKNQKLNYKIISNSKDEIGVLTDSFNEMAESIKTLNDDLNHKLFTDDLTGLGNRRAYHKDVKLLKKPILYIVDIDFFKNINDYYGTDAGNFVLKEFAKIVKIYAKQEGVFSYRIGSDEFLFLQDFDFDRQYCVQFIEKFMKLLSNKKFKNLSLNIDITLSATCGISYGSGNLLEESDLALNEAKIKKSVNMIFSKDNPHMNRYKENLLWRQKIQYAISNDMIIPFFQPIIDIKNPEDKKYESLVRIVDDGKIISPYMFLEIAKETKLYSDITKVMVEKTFKVFAKNLASFSVNISVDDITNEETVQFLYDKIAQYDIGNRLIFEILESEEISNFNIVMSFINKMKKKGVRFAIDDFGSGYSNFSYLLQIQPDFIKIDGSIIKNLAKNSNEYHIVNAIIKFAKTLNTKIIAEHVSSPEIVSILKGFDVDYMQGYYFSEPMETLYGHL